MVQAWEGFLTLLNTVGHINFGKFTQLINHATYFTQFRVRLSVGVRVIIRDRVSAAQFIECAAQFIDSQNAPSNTSTTVTALSVH